MARLAGSSRLLRAMNESATLALLLEHGAMTRNELRSRTGLSKPTVSIALRRLTDAGLARVAGHVSAGPGPNAEVYSADPDAGYAVAISVRAPAGAGGSAVAAAACDLAGAVRGRYHATIDFPGTDPVAAVADVLARLCAHAGLDARRVGHVHLGVPGCYDPRTDTIHHVELPGWQRAGLVREVRARLDTALGVDNDVNLAAIAERRHGTARDADGFALLWLDTGLGLAIDLGGTLLRGARGGAGEIGYMPLPVLDAGGGGLRRAKADFQDLVGAPAVLALAAEHGLRAGTAAHAVRTAAARTGATDSPGADAAAVFLAALADRIAIGLAAVVAVLDPPLVVLAGEIARAGGSPLAAAVDAAMRQAAPIETAVAVTALDEDAVLLGGLDAGLAALREAIIGSLHLPTAGDGPAVRPPRRTADRA